MIRAFAASMALVGFVTLAGDVGAEHHEGGEKSLPAWNQDDVASLAKDLQASAKRLRAMERSMPTDSVASGQSRARDAYRDKLRALENESRSLADLVGKGKTRDESRNLFNRIQELGRDAAEEARRMFLSRDTIDEIQKAEAITNKLRIYYEGSPNPLPALVGPKKDGDESENE